MKNDSRIPWGIITLFMVMLFTGILNLLNIFFVNHSTEAQYEFLERSMILVVGSGLSFAGMMFEAQKVREIKKTDLMQYEIEQQKREDKQFKKLENILLKHIKDEYEAKQNELNR